MSEDYGQSDYVDRADAVTSTDVHKLEKSAEKSAIKAARADLEKLEDDSDTYETRRPYRKVIRARVIR
jgi:hypothetical protein